MGFHTMRGHYNSVAKIALFGKPLLNLVAAAQ